MNHTITSSFLPFPPFEMDSSNPSTTKHDQIETKHSSYPAWFGMDGARSQMLMSLGMISSLRNEDLSTTAVSVFVSPEPTEEDKAFAKDVGVSLDETKWDDEESKRGSTDDESKSGSTGDEEPSSTVEEDIARGIRIIEKARISRLQSFARHASFRYRVFSALFRLYYGWRSPTAPIRRDTGEFDGHPEWTTSCCLREWHGLDVTYGFDSLKGGPSFYDYTPSEGEIERMGKLYDERVEIEEAKKPEDRMALHELLNGVALAILPSEAVPPFGPVF